ncbi:MAG: hypothetical protein BMS9Abin12_2358 [Acidimicrobiia bacterium]|nr:MAG: hypothetical protein BMS9Abin12_2358 [Acidimicrobiia bacterium]
MRKSLRRSRQAADEPQSIPAVPDGVLQVCHPDWRGVRASARAFRDPVFEARDLSTVIGRVADITEAGVETVVIQGWPPNAAAFATALSASGMRVLAVFHSSPAQHGVDGGEAEAVNEMLELHRSGVVSGVATIKAGVAGSLRSLGYDVAHIGNRVPKLGTIAPAPVVEGTNVGIFLYPMWRKNVTTQILAAHSLGWRPFVMDDPCVPYLSRNDLTICGELPREEFLTIQAAMDLTLNVTLSECHPIQPMESYRLGVPCLISRTSDLFIEDPGLYELTTVDQTDNPDAIADGARRLLANRAEVVPRANAVLDAIDRRSAGQWRTFVRR